MDIREARRADWPALEALVRGSFQPDHRTANEVYLGLDTLADKLRALVEEFDASGSTFLAAFEGETALGAILVRRRVPGEAWIDDLYLTPEGRKRGIGIELVSAAIPPDFLAGAEVNALNAANLDLFKQIGFQRVVETVVLRREPQA